jgi:hypothetical protein
MIYSFCTHIRSTKYIPLNLPYNFFSNPATGC